MDSLKPEELSQLSEKVEKGEGLTDEEAQRILQSLPSLKKTVDGLYSRTKTAEEKLGITEGEKKKLEEELAAKKTPPAAQPAQPVTPDLSIKEVLKLRKEGFSDEEILNLSERANSLGVPVDKILSDPIFKSGIAAEREKARIEQGTPVSTPSSSIVNGKSWDEIALKGTPAEQEQSFRKLMEQKSGGNRQSI